MDILAVISISDILISILGGLIFGLAIFTIRSVMLEELEQERYWSYVKYITAVMILFYITFPMAHGLLTVMEGNGLERWTLVTVTYAVFLGSFVVSTIFGRNWFCKDRIECKSEEENDD